MSDPEVIKYRGHMTMADGSHVALSADEAEMMWRESEAATARLAAEMPDDAAALAVMSRAHSRLRELGWRDIIYCPKDGTWFDAIEAKSSGIHDCQYTGEWPNGSWWIASDGDLWPSHPILFRLGREAEAARRTKMAEAAEQFRQEDLATHNLPEPPSHD